jgi:hypothetical protein
MEAGGYPVKFEPSWGTNNKTVRSFHHDNNIKTY